MESNLAEATRNNAYSLLNQLLDEEKDVSKLRIIKRENSDLKNLLKEIATTARNAKVQLEKFAKEDPSLVLDDYALPPGEQKTRDSISDMQQHDILHHSGDDMELYVLLTQIESLNYAQHLAKVAAQYDSNPERIHFLRQLSDDMHALHDRVLERLTLRKSASENVN